MITGILFAVQVSLWVAVAIYPDPAAWQPLRLVPGQFMPHALVTAPLLHLEIFHLAINMVLLWLLGRPLERSLGSLPFFLLYLGSALAAGLMHLSITLLLPGQEGGPASGASGAIAGLMGAYAVRFSTQGGLPLPRAKSQGHRFPTLRIGRKLRGAAVSPRARAERTLQVPTALLLWAGLEVAQGVAAMIREQGAAVGHWAHIGGFVFGLAVAQWMGAGRAAEVERLLREVGQGRRALDEARPALHDLLGRGCTPEELDLLVTAAPPAARRLFEEWIEEATARDRAACALPLYHAVRARWGELRLSPAARAALGEPPAAGAPRG